MGPARALARRGGIARTTNKKGGVFPRPLSQWRVFAQSASVIAVLKAPVGLVAMIFWSSSAFSVRS